MAESKKSDSLTLKLASVEELQEGQWIEIPLGINCLICPQNTPEFFRAASAMAKKYGGRKASVTQLGDLRGDKLLAAANATAARANWKAYRPSVRIKGELYEDSLDSRFRLLQSFPELRDQINEAIAEVSEGFSEDVEELEGN